MNYNQSVKEEMMHPDLVKKLKKLKSLCKENGISIKFSEGYRTVAEQNELYAQGRTKPGNVVTNARGSSYSSQHQWGIAADFYLNMDIDGDGDKKDDAFNDVTNMFSRVGRLAEEVGLSWGGNWTRIVDKPHLYLGKWGSTTSSLRSIYGSYEAFKKTWNNSNGTDSGNSGFSMSIYATKDQVKELQRIIGAKVDGIGGPETLSKTPTVQYGDRGLIVNWLQRFLSDNIVRNLVIDGIFGTNTKNAVIKYQALSNLAVKDGVLDAGKNTWRKILGII